MAVITGAGHGIGKAIAEAFAREGAAVQCLDLDEDAAAAAARSCASRGAGAPRGLRRARLGFGGAPV